MYLKIVLLGLSYLLVSYFEKKNSFHVQEIII